LARAPGRGDRGGRHRGTAELRLGSGGRASAHGQGGARLGAGQSMSVCPACAKDVDPLRAGHVAIFDERFYYFCDRACREKLAPLGHLSREPAKHRIPTPREPSPAIDARTRGERNGVTNGAARHAPGSDVVELEEAAAPSSAPPSLGALVRDAKKAAAPGEVGAALAWASVAAGVMAISLV